MKVKKLYNSSKLVISSMFLLLLIGCNKSQPAEEIIETVIETISAWQQQFDIGARYLLDGNYEEAIIAFTVAIEIDPKNPDAYIERANAYMGNAEIKVDQKEILYGKALVDLEMAFELGDNRAEEQIQKLQELIKQMEVDKINNELLKPLFEYFVAGEMESAIELMRMDKYQNMSGSVGEGYFYYDDGGTEGLAVYANNFYYFGQWKNGERSGNGLWIKAVFENESIRVSYFYEGEWSNDMPNGKGRITEVNKKEEGRRRSILTEREGSFLNGLYDGVFNEVWNMSDGTTKVWTPITVVNGFYQPMENIPQIIQQRDYYQKRIENGEKIIAIEQSSSLVDLWVNTSKPVFVLGFES